MISDKSCVSCRLLSPLFQPSFRCTVGRQEQCEYLLRKLFIFVKIVCTMRSVCYLHWQSIFSLSFSTAANKISIAFSSKQLTHTQLTLCMLSALAWCRYFLYGIEWTTFSTLDNNHYNICAASECEVSISTWHKENRPRNHAHKSTWLQWEEKEGISSIAYTSRNTYLITFPFIKFIASTLPFQLQFYRTIV